jgi:hypothetical protein
MSKRGSRTKKTSLTVEQALQKVAEDLMKHSSEQERRELGQKLLAQARVRRCLRGDGTERKWFEAAEAAAAFREQHPNYFGDVVVLCKRCGRFHCSRPEFVRPWETPIEEVKVN